MDQTTRAFIRLLGADPAAAVVDRLTAGEASKGELARELGLDSREVARTLADLLLLGIVRYENVRGPRGGRPRQVWRVVAGDELEELEEYVRAMRKRLLDRNKRD